MQIHFKTREQARKAPFGKLVDNGANAQHGKRYAREIQTEKKIALLGKDILVRHHWETYGCTQNKPLCHSPTFDKIVPVFVRGKNKL